MQWLTNGQTRKYTYAYDPLSRLTKATYTGPTTTEKYQTAYTYDKHGNIKTLERYGKTTASAFGIVDKLTMGYTGNQLTNVTDAGVAVSLSESNDFKKGSTTNPGYAYNKNGAMTKDLNKNITGISYNSLNLPKTLTMVSQTQPLTTTVNGAEVELSSAGQTLASGIQANFAYTYAADGRKLRVVQGGTTRDYAGNNPMRITDPTGMDWYINEFTGELYYNVDLVDMTITYNDNRYTRIGANDMMREMSNITEKSYDFDASKSFAEANGYNINPTQQILSEVSREQPYKTGPNTVTTITGDIEIVTEKYGIFPETNSHQVTTSKKLQQEATGVWDIIGVIATGGKSKDFIERLHHTYKIPDTKDKTLTGILKVYDFLAPITSGSHDYRNKKVYKNWNDYSNATNNKGRLLKFKQ